MAVEQDWAAYADQAHVKLNDTFLARTSAGAGVEIPGSHFVARRSNGGQFLAEGDLSVSDGSNSVNLSASQGAIELTRTDGFAYIDFRSSIAEDLDCRIQQSGNGLVFLTGGQGATATRLTIDAGGNVVVGTTSATGIFNGSSTNPGTVIESTGSVLSQRNNGANVFLSKASGYTDNAFAKFAVAGSFVGSITTTGSATSYNTSSDYRLKTNLRPLTGALDRILSLPVYEFDWINGGKDVRGFLAHEYGEVIPGAATGEKDAEREEEYEIEPARETGVLGPDGKRIIIPATIGKRMVPEYQGIDQSKAVPDLVGAVQELAAMVASLQERIAVLEAST